MSVEEIKSEIENLTSKSISEVIAFALRVLEQRDPEASATLNSRMSDTNSDPLVSEDEIADSKEDS